MGIISTILTLIPLVIVGGLIFVAYIGYKSFTGITDIAGGLLGGVTGGLGITCEVEEGDKEHVKNLGDPCDASLCYNQCKENLFCNEQTSKCDEKKVGGKLCLTGQEIECDSGDCDCAYPTSSGDECFCAPKIDRTVPNGDNCWDDDWCESGWCNSETWKCDKRISGGDNCYTGDEAQCDGGDCDCKFPHSSGDTCLCAPKEGTKLPDGKSCYDDEWCQSNWCNSETEKCDSKKESGEVCLSGDESECKSDDCNCDTGYFSGSTCFCQPNDDNVVPDGGRCHANWWCQSDLCHDTTCIAKAGEGESCAAGDGDDDYCKENLACAQYGSNDYKCCKNSTTPFGATSEYCTGVADGGRCEWDQQCGENSQCVNKAASWPKYCVNEDNVSCMGAAGCYGPKNLSDGQPCQYDDQCHSYHHGDGECDGNMHGISMTGDGRCCPTSSCNY